MCLRHRAAAHASATAVAREVIAGHRLTPAVIRGADRRRGAGAIQEVIVDRVDAVDTILPVAREVRPGRALDRDLGRRNGVEMAVEEDTTAIAISMIVMWKIKSKGCLFSRRRRRVGLGFRSICSA
jgi:hypothetical protein